jgi:hypothetical protein
MPVTGEDLRVFVFVKHVSQFTITQGQEGRKHQQMKGVWNLWRTFLQKIVKWRSMKYHKVPGFHQHQYSVFWQTICSKEKFVPDGTLTAWLLNRWRNAWRFQHYWNKYLTLNVKHSCIEFSVLTKRGLETFNRIWNRSNTSGEVETPRDTKNFDDRIHRGFIMTNQVPRGKSVTAALYPDCLLKLRRKMHKNWPDFLGDGLLILHDNACPNLG